MQIIKIPNVPDIDLEERVTSAMTTNNNTDTFADIIDNLSITCQIELRIDEDDSKPWVIYALNKDGTRKNKGGDEYYISYTDHTNNKSAVAILEDCNDVSYILEFCTLPHEEVDSSTFTLTSEEQPKRGSLTVHFEYSCGIGKLSPPSKREWENGGYTHAVYVIEDIPQPMNIRRFQKPTVVSNKLNYYDLIVVFGDSTYEQFVRQRTDKKGRYFFQPNLTFHEKIKVGMDSNTVEQFLELLEFQHGDKLRNTNNNNNNKIALLTGSFMWDILNYQDTIQGICNYADHEDACRKCIGSIRQRYPGVDILWKSPTAVHIHWVDLNRLVPQPSGEGIAALFGLDRVRYMSRSRSVFFYKLQKKICSDLNVQFLDIYEATHLAASKLYPSDGRHFKPDFNRLMLSWFYDEYAVQQKYYDEPREIIESSRRKEN